MSALYFSQAVEAANERRRVYAALGLDCIPAPLASIPAPHPVIPPKPFAGSYALERGRLRKRHFANASLED